VNKEDREHYKRMEREQDEGYVGVSETIRYQAFCFHCFWFGERNLNHGGARLELSLHIRTDEHLAKSPNADKASDQPI
jgi:hypothetical protein